MHDLNSFDTYQQPVTSALGSVSSQKNKKRIRQIASLLVLVVMTGSAFVFAKRVTSPVHTPEKSKAAAMTYVKTMNLYYVPPESEMSTKQIEVTELRQAVKSYLEYASSFHHNLSNQAVTFDQAGPVVWRSEIRPQLTGITDQGALKVATITKMLNEQRPEENGKSICQLIEENDIDQVWLWFDSFVDKTPGDEFLMVNPTSNYGSVNYRDNICGSMRSFSILGFAVNLPPAFAIHSFAHYMERLAKNLQGGELVEGRFQGVKPANDQTSSLKVPNYNLSDRCGNVHTPPNSTYDATKNLYVGYQYDNTGTVESMCEDWQPNDSGQKKPLSNSNWMNLPMPAVPPSIPEPISAARYSIWWLQHFPQAADGLVYQGRPIPTWWTFIADTDEKIAAYMSANYWMNPDLWFPVNAKTTASCTSETGTYSSCTYTPGSSVLGVSTKNDQVLAATTYGDMALVTVSYAGSTTSVVSVTFCGENMTRVGTAAANGGGTKNEMWYKLAPQSGVCPVTVKFSADPGQRVVSTTIFNNVDQVNPVTGTSVGGFSGPYTATAGTINATMSGPKDSLMVCGYAHYSEQSNPPSGNFATPKVGTSQLWTFQQAKYPSGAPVNTWAGIGAGRQRLINDEVITLGWDTVKQQPNSYTCANFNIKPFTSVVLPTPTPVLTPTPSPVPTPTPTPVPTPSVVSNTGWVDLKINAQDGPVTITSTTTPLTISWKTGASISTCKLSGAGLSATSYGSKFSVPVSVDDYFAKNIVPIAVSLPTGSKTAPVPPMTYEAVTKPLQSGTYNFVISCMGQWGPTFDSVRVVVTPTLHTALADDGEVFLQVNGIGQGNNNGLITPARFVGGPITFQAGTAISLSWKTASRYYKTPGTFSACVASNGWTGAKATSGTQSLGALPAGSYNFTLKCKYTPYSMPTAAYEIFTYVPVVIQNAGTAVKPYWRNAQFYATETAGLFKEKLYTYSSSVCGLGTINATCKLFESSNLKKDWNVNGIWYSDNTVGSSIGAVNYYAAKWSAQYIPLQSGSHTFISQNAGSMRVYLDGVLVIDRWPIHTTTTDSYTATLIAGKPYTLKIEYYVAKSVGTEKMNFQVGVTTIRTATGGPAYAFTIPGDSDLPQGGL